MRLLAAILSAFGFLFAIWGGDFGLTQVLPADHWRQPLAPQGQPPRSWTPRERSLRPEDCGVCHADKLAQWQTSLHAKAFSPGLVGQLLTYDAEDTAACMQCHAPLAEQWQAFETARRNGKAHVTAEQGLAAAGNACGGCHVRGYRRFGPPHRRTGAVGQSDPNGPHGGVMRTADFEKSEFCAVCHQFSQDQAVNGKPLENTNAEWQASQAAREGKTCQTCHMPDRKHLWRGIHDPDMVRTGVTPEFLAEPNRAVFRLTNSGVGHAFPTYVTPKVVMMAVALDAANEPIAGSEISSVIQRRVDSVDGDWVEQSDTRLLPGQTATLELPWTSSGLVRLWLEVHPDDFYEHQVYDKLLPALPQDSASHELIAAANARARANRYRLFETTLRRP